MQDLPVQLIRVPHGRDGLRQFGDIDPADVIVDDSPSRHQSPQQIDNRIGGILGIRRTLLCGALGPGSVRGCALTNIPYGAVSPRGPVTEQHMIRLMQQIRGHPTKTPVVHRVLHRRFIHRITASSMRILC